jgi:hypothetical protein
MIHNAPSVCVVPSVYSLWCVWRIVDPARGMETIGSNLTSLLFQKFQDATMTNPMNDHDGTDNG